MPKDGKNIWLFPHGQQLELVMGDLTRETVEAIVNAANAHLQHGGGLAGAIVRAGGAQIQAESNAWVRKHGPVPHDHPAVTTAGALPCRLILHAVGPVWGSGNEVKKLAAAVRGALETAEDLGLTSLAIPPISTGIFGFPKELAAPVFFDEIASFFQSRVSTRLLLVRLVMIDRQTYDVFTRSFQDWAAHMEAQS